MSIFLSFIIATVYKKAKISSNYKSGTNKAISQQQINQIISVKIFYIKTVLKLDLIYPLIDKLFRAIH